MVNVLQQPALIVGRKGNILAVNAVARKLLRLTSAAHNVNFQSLFPKAFRDFSTAALIRRFAAGKKSVALFRADGTSFKARLRAVSTGEGSVAVLLTVAAEAGRGHGVDVQTEVQYVPELLPIEGVDSDGPYKFLLQSAPFGIAVVQNERVVIANNAFARILGYRTANDLEGKGVDSFVEAQSLRSFRLLMSRQLSGGTVPSRFEVRFLRSNGTVVDVEVSFALGLYTGQAALAVSINDITERKQLENRLIDSERLFRNVVNSMVDALVITDLQGRILDVNDEFEKLTGYTRKEVFGLEIPHPWVADEDLRSYILWLDQLREKNYLRDFDVVWSRKDGTRLSVSLSTTLLRNATGDPVLMVNIARDITERQYARHELALQFQRLQVLYELIRALTETWEIGEVARITYDHVQRIIPVDAFFIDLYDDSRKMLHPLLTVDTDSQMSIRHEVQESPLALDDAPACKRVIETRRSFLETRSAGDVEQHYRPFGNQERISKSLMFVPMFSKNRIIGILSTQSYEENRYSSDQLALLESIASVTGIAIEKVNLYQETVRKSNEIEARNRELDDFTYVVSHDLKEPLISVDGYAKILRYEYGKAIDESGVQFIQSILDSCAHMKKLIEDLLELSRIGRMAELRNTVDVRALIDEVLEELQFTIQERKAEVIVTDGVPSVMGVEPYLKIVFRNLISNALKFSDKAVPRVEIGYQPDVDQPAFYVRDNGIGIDPAYHQKIFMIFQRLHKKEEFEGTGAGLTIVKKIIEAHGGRIWLDSTPGEGTTFYFSLPTA